MKARKLHIDILRMAAIFWVIYIHTGKYGYSLFSDLTGVPYWFSMILSVVSKSAVPLFFAISGAVLLNKDEPIGKIWAHRVPKIAFSLLVVALLYYINQIQKAGEAFRLGDFMTRLYQGEIMNHLWFLYAYLGFLILLPFYRALAQTLSKEEFLYFLCIGIVSGPVITLLQNMGGLHMESHLALSPVRTSYIFYPLLGYYLEHMVEKSEFKFFLPAGIAASILFVYLACRATDALYLAGHTKIGELEQFFGLTAFVLVPTVYLLFRSIRRLPWMIWNVIITFAPCTMGVYILHMFLIDSDMSDKFRAILSTNVPGAISSNLIYCFAVWVAMYGLSWLVSKIPFVNKLIGI